MAAKHRVSSSKLHDLKADLDAYQVYTPEQIDDLMALYLGGTQRDRLDAAVATSPTVALTTGWWITAARAA